MPVLRRVEYWPTTGYRDELWAEDPADAHPSSNRFLRASRAPADALSELLESRAFQSRNSAHFRLIVGVHKETHVTVNLWEKYLGGEEGGRIFVPSDLHNQNQADVRRLAGEALIAAMRSLAQIRGLDQQMVSDSASALRDAGYRYDFEGPWKADASRGARARIVGQLDFDGYSRIALQVEEDATIHEYASVIGATTREGIKRAAKSLRWSRAGTVSFADGDYWHPTSYEVDPSTDARIVWSPAPDESQPLSLHSPDVDIRVSLT